MGLDPGEQMQRMRGMSEQQKIAEASKQFESVLIHQFLKDATKPMIKGYLNGDGPGADFYQYFITDTLATSITEGGGLGLSSVLQAQLTPRHLATKEKAE